MMTTNCLSVWHCSKHAASMETDLCQYYLCSDLWQSMCKYVSYKYKTPSTETNTLKNICKYKTALQIYIHCIYPQAFVNPVFILELKKNNNSALADLHFTQFWDKCFTSLNEIHSYHSYSDSTWSPARLFIYF